MPDLSHIRNFCIIAHIDHGKSTLADRLMELTETVEKRDLREQLLDDMDLERERGITIKAHPVTMKYRSQDGDLYEFNLIDTPGHVDFSYEVTRSLSACEGAILVVDAAQGVEAQTVANAHMAIQQNLKIIPVLNKIDLPNANVKEVSRQIEDLLAIPMDDAFYVSAKTGEGAAPILEGIVKQFPPPKLMATDSECRALVFDSVYNTFRGVVSYVRVFDGLLKRGDRIQMMSSGQSYEVKEVGQFMPEPAATETLGAGDVGYLIANIKNAADIKIGDTVTHSRQPAKEPLPGFAEMHPMVFSGLYPINAADYGKLSASLEKLRLNDSSFLYQAESSVALGFGFRCGFLGLLHMEIVQERLRREFDMDLIATYPSVIYNVYLTNDKMIEVDNPVKLPDPSVIDHIEEPVVTAHIISRNEDIGDMMRLIMDKRGGVTKTESLDTQRVMLTCELPFNEILVDFHDSLKSISHGYASMDYEHSGYRMDNLVKLDILVHGECVDAFSSIIHRSKAEIRGRDIVKALKKVIPPQLFQIPLQAAIGRRIIARETIRALRKDVTAKCYGGDITRKRKLLERQKKGKKMMKQVGKVSIPQDAFISVLRSSD